MNEQDHIKALSRGWGTLTERNKQYTLDPQPVIRKDAPAFPLPPDKFAIDLQELIDAGVVIGVSDRGLDFKSTSGEVYVPGSATWPQIYGAFKVTHAQNAQPWIDVAKNVCAASAPRAGEVTLWDVTLREESGSPMIMHVRPDALKEMGLDSVAPNVMAITRSMCK